MNDQDLAALLQLHRYCAGHSPTLDRLLAGFGSPGAVLAAIEAGEPAAQHIPSTLQKARAADRGSLAEDLRWLEAEHHHLVVRGDPAYPSLLLEIADPPLLLFVDGDVAQLQCPHLAVVGSRRTTHAGRRTSTEMAGAVASSGLVIASGLAMGVDASAHLGALEAGGRTTAILGTGCDELYPRGNRRLAERIRADGALVSEFPLGTGAHRWNFPQRNRIVTGMSLGTLVVEAAERSGSLISARLSAEQGREVFAVPGSIYNLQARGCHRLIRDGALLVESASEILLELGLVPADGEAGTASEKFATANNLAAEHREVITALKAGPLGLDGLASVLGWPAGRLLGVLTELEVAGLIAQTPDGYELA